MQGIGMVQFCLRKKYIFFCIFIPLIASCANKPLISQKLPLISHAHIGHALTAWRGTPGEQGLFIVAEKEIQIVLNEITKALKSNESKPEIREHLSNTLHALDPKLQLKGTGLNYGAIRSLDEATNHMLYAAQSKDASDNLKDMVAKFNDSQVYVSSKMKLAVEITQLVQQVSGPEQTELLRQLQRTLYSVLNGEDYNHDGKIDLSPDEIGLLQLRKIISKGLRNEVPAYQPVGKKYLLGLVRLPNGNWEYKFNASNSRKRLSFYH